MSVILASKSAARRAVLDGAGVPYEALVAGVDEDAVKASLLAEGAGPRDIADALAELKAIRVSRGPAPSASSEAFTASSSTPATSAS